MNDNISTLTDNRLRALDQMGADQDLLKSINSDLLWIKKQLTSFKIGNNDVVIKSLLSRLMDNDCSEELINTPIPTKVVTVNRNGVITKEAIS